MLFMGTEYAQFREWDYDNSLEWFMLDYPDHKYFREYVASLNAFYLDHSELWEIDFVEDGFKWLLPDEADKNLVAFKRLNKKGKELTVVLNFSGSTQHAVISCSKGLRLESVFDTGDFSPEQRTVKIEKQGKEYRAEVVVPPFSGVIFKQVNSNKKI